MSGLILRDAEMNLIIHIIHPAEGDVVVLSHGGEIHFGEFNLITLDVINATHMMAV